MPYKNTPSLRGMEPRTAQYQEEKVQQEAFFQQAGAYLVIDGAPIILAKVQEYERALAEYNKKLMKNFRLRIRPKQTTTIRGRKYTYLGRYMYIRSGINTLSDLAIPEEEKSSKVSSKAKTSKAKKSGGGKVENDRTSFTNLETAPQLDPNLTEHYTTQGTPKSLDYEPDKSNEWDYVGKVESCLEAPDFQHVFKEIGYPPVPSIKDLKYSIVVSKGKDTNHIILPSTLVMNAQVNPLLSGLTLIPVG